MRVSPIIFVPCLSLIVASCKPSSAIERTPDEEQVEDTAPVIIQEAVWDEPKNEITLTLTEQEAYDASLLEIIIVLFKSSDGDFVQVEEQASSRWLTVAKGDMASPAPQLVIYDMKSFDRLVVDLAYDSEQIGSRTFDFKKEGEQGGDGDAEEAV
ncbi:hypothetical protein HZ994_09370 [Akkermansiaceae bacterium]|nr:hypothetical protein HZ994_09370 [Akkermansiaceae bacterium]